MPSALRYRGDIDGLRALAVMMVAAYHAFPETLRGGFIGVDIFFVISGYLITQILLRDAAAGQWNIAAFYTRRIRRIFPALLLVLVSCLMFGWFTLFAVEYTQLGKHVAAGAGFAANLALLSEQGYFDTLASAKPLLHLWSLGVEEQFYIVWPVLLWAAMRWRVGSAALIIAVVVASFAANYALLGEVAVDFYSPLTRVWELALGALLAQATLHEAPKDYPILSWLGAGLLGLGLMLITSAQPYPGVLALLPTLGAALLIAGGEGAWLNRVLAWGPLAALGRISYPFYLWHWPLLCFAGIIVIGPLSVMLRVALLVTALILAWLTYRYVERPLRFAGDVRSRVRLLVVSMLVVGAMGWMVWQRDGMPSRTALQHYAYNARELVRPVERDAACIAMVTLSPDSYCRFNDVGGKHTVAVIGDSYAYAAFSGMAELLQRRGVNTLLLGNPGCAPLLGERTTCAERTDAVLAALVARKDISQVFITFHGSAYLLGDAVMRDEVSPALSADAAMPMLRGLQASIDRLRQAGIRSYFIIEHPVTNIQAATCVARPLRPAGKVCEVARAKVEMREAPYRAMVARLKRVTVIDSIDAFCPGEQCLMLQDGVLLYYDDAHLSFTGSRLLAEKVLAPYLQD